MEKMKLEITKGASGELAIQFIGRKPSGAELEALMHQLAIMRSATQPPVEEQGPLERRESRPMVVNPYVTVNWQYTGELVLGFRHTAYGWLYFQFQPQMAKNAFGDLAKRLNASDRQPPGR